MRRIQSYSAPGITVTFDPNRCIHATVCLRTLPAVFDLSRARWVSPEKASVDEVVAAVARCPSGALAHRLEPVAADGGVAAETATDPDEAAAGGTYILTSPNGPLLVEGDFALLDAEGNAIPTPGRAALCRCGASRNKPFCDNSHLAHGFRTDDGS